MLDHSDACGRMKALMPLVLGDVNSRHNVISYLRRSIPEQRDRLNLSSVSNRPCLHPPRSVTF